jgi:predicted GNAT family acetyltransferase
MQSQVVDRLKDKLQDVEASLQREKEAYAQIQVVQSWIIFLTDRDAVIFFFFYYKARSHACSKPSRVRETESFRVA